MKVIRIVLAFLVLVAVGSSASKAKNSYCTGPHNSVQDHDPSPIGGGSSGSGGC